MTWGWEKESQLPRVDAGVPGWGQEGQRLPVGAGGIPSLWAWAGGRDGVGGLCCSLGWAVADRGDGVAAPGPPEVSCLLWAGLHWPHGS